MASWGDVAWAAGVTLLNAVTSAGFASAGLLAEWTKPGSARVFAMYAAARSLPLLLATVWLVVRRSPGALAQLGLLLALIQASDVLVGFTQADLGKTLGPAVFAALTLLASRALAKRALAG